MSETTPGTPRKDDNPYAYGAVWVHDETGRTVSLLNVFADQEGLAGLEPGTAYVVITPGTTGPPQVWAVYAFLSLFSRRNGSAPAPDPALLAALAAFPRQRTS